MYLTVKQVAERLGISEALVYVWIEGGDLPCYRLGGKGKRGTIRVAEADLTAFLEARKSKAERAAAASVSPPRPPKLPVLQNLRLNPS